MRPVSTEGASFASDLRWYRVWKEPGAPAFRLGRDGEDLVAEWEGIAALRAARDGRRHEVVLSSDLSGEFREKFCSGPVRSLLRHLHGGMTLHGSAVALQGGALAFLGESGSGKSTEAADMCYRLRGSLLADDLVFLEERDGAYHVEATDSAHWLLPDSLAAMGWACGDGEGKSRIPARQPVAAERPRTVPLRAMIPLSFDEAAGPPTLRPLAGLELFEAVNRGFVRFVIDEPEVLVRDLDQIARLSAAVPMFRLIRRRAFADLEDVARVLLELAERLAHPNDVKSDGTP